MTKINPTGTALVYSVYSTYLGGSGMDTPVGICVDSSGNAYLAGTTQSGDFPTQSAFQENPPNNGGRSSIFISKLNPDGKALIYSTYLASNSVDIADAVAIDASGAVYVAGEAGSGFPLNGPLQLLKEQGSRVLIKMNPAGDALVYIRVIGDTPSISDLAVDSTGAAFVVGNPSTGFTLVNSLQASSLGAPDAYLAKINPQGNAVDYFTLLGGGSVEFNDFVPFVFGDQATGVAVDAAGDAYVTGFTYMDNFPTYNAIFPSFTQPAGDVGRFLITPATTNFVTKISNSADIPLTKITIDPGAGVVYVDGFSRVAGQKRSYLWVPGSEHLLSVGENAPGLRGTFGGGATAAPPRTV
ncbi:MAG: SBBP repeat-containing protein [Bryobacteraceae bacterium]